MTEFTTRPLVMGREYALSSGHYLASADGTPNLFLYDPGSEGSVRAALGLSGDGEPSLILFDAGQDGASRAAMSLFDDGSAGFSVSDSLGKSGVSAQVNQDGSPTVVISDSEGNAVWGAP